MIPHSRPSIGQREADAVLEVLRSGFVAGGPQVERFERRLSGVLQLPYVLATQSGTSALHLALLALKIKRGDEVLIPSYACAALCHAVHYVQAIPVLVDAEAGGFNMDVAAAARNVGRRTRAVVVPHLFGTPLNLRPLAASGVPIVEDCAQSLGASVRGRPCGTQGTVAVLSFYATKVLASGQGGAVACRSAALHKSVADLRTYDERTPYKVRYNYAMSDLHAALASVQLERLEEFVARRRVLERMYRSALDGLPIEVPTPAPGAIPYRFIVRVPRTRLAAIVRRMQERMVFARRPVFRPLHRLLGLSRAAYPHAEAAWGEILSLPLYPSLTEDDVLRVADTLRMALHR